ncbi:MAG: hypothetical protein ACLPYS_01105 [Vulcanimicrobiaceae bacterium]
MGPRFGLSTTLIAGAVTLLIAVAVGNAVGGRVIGQVIGRVPALMPTPYPVLRNAPLESAEPAPPREEQVMSVATDPGFPDPRVTPEPEPPPTPRPTPTAAPTPSPNKNPVAEPSHWYSSPPLLVPLASPSPFSDEQAQQPRPETSSSPRGADAGHGGPATLVTDSPATSSGSKP